ncbi:MAG: hypothetical protein ACOX6T_04230 [Myxococcales bacterium]|jgi:hypothetical protein
MALSKELLAKLGEGSDLARACDVASVDLKVLLACWDGLDSEEEKVLGAQQAAFLTVEQVKERVEGRLAKVRAGEPEEDRILDALRETVGKVPADLREEVGRALLADGLPIIAADKVLSRQERELVLDELVPALGLARSIAESLLDSVEPKR